MVDPVVVEHVAVVSLDDLKVEQGTPLDLLKGPMVDRDPFLHLTMMTEKEVSPTLIKKIVGHSGAMSLTEKVYTHVNVQELLEAINKI